MMETELHLLVQTSSEKGTEGTRSSKCWTTCTTGKHLCLYTSQFAKHSLNPPGWVGMVTMDELERQSCELACPRLNGKQDIKCVRSLGNLHPAHVCTLWPCFLPSPCSPNTRHPYATSRFLGTMAELCGRFVFCFFFRLFGDFTSVYKILLLSVSSVLLLLLQSPESFISSI